ncbi:MAG: nucleotidyltransferase family protein, partial [Butyrivibrio sp.]|nr:nucleotidyltransferase family protein [Butyrivibrio sp.]
MAEKTAEKTTEKTTPAEKKAVAEQTTEKTQEKQIRAAFVIAEFNPFHNGHAAILRKAREKAEADFVCVVLSGDFVQRGEPAIAEKYTRTRMALMNGADVVFELPLYYSLGSAEFFARGAVSLINRLGVCDALVF